MVMACLRGRRIYLGLFFSAFLFTGWIWRLSISPILNSDKHVDGSGLKLSEPVCWREKPSTAVRDRAGVLEIMGGGCRECEVGHTCRFQLHFHHPTPFKLMGHDTSHPDLMITITGPTVFHATARELVGDTWDGGIRFEATYTTWDAGNYTAFAESGCAWGSEPFFYQPLATWSLRVKEASSRLPAPLPCQFGQLARWVPNDAPAPPAPAPELSWPSWQGNDLDLVRRPDWKLGYYDCATAGGRGGGAAVVTWEDVPRALLDVGIREMSFIGDSHMRALVFSLVYGVMTAQDPGYQIEMSWHVNRVWDLPVIPKTSITPKTPKTPKSNQTLRINFYWLGGLYEEEDGQYGCTRWGLESGWPANYSSSSDVVVMDGGAWANQGCDKPRAVLARSLPRFLETIMAIEHKPETMFVWKSVPPYPLPVTNCERNPSRSTDLVWANDLFRAMADAFQVHFFDFWPLEAPRYTETCRFYKDGALWQDHHFLCMLHGWDKVWGAVGMDTGRHFLELLWRTAQAEREKAGR